MDGARMDLPLSLYHTLADELGQLIDTRVFRPGERLPSIRHLARHKRVSISTVVSALQLLEERGTVEVRPQSGHYVSHRPLRREPVLNDMLRAPTYVGINNQLMRIMQANERAGMSRLAAAYPPEELLLVKGMQRTVGSVARRHPDLLSRGSYVRLAESGLLRQLVRRAVDWGELDHEEVVITNSCTEALFLCLSAVCKPGDTVAIESPTYFVLLQQIESLGLKALEIPCDPGTGLSVDALELAIQQGLVQACLLIPNCNNPLGSIMTEADKKRLAALVSKHDILLIEDDIYSDVCFGEQRPRPVKAYDRTGNVLLCCSFSKNVSFSFKVGYVAAGKYVERVSFLKTISSGTTSHFHQTVLAELIDGSGYNNHLRRVRRLLAQRSARLGEAILRAFPAGCRPSEPQGGFVIWIEMPARVDAMALHAKAVEEGIGFLPGPMFSASGKFANFIRLNAANAWDDEVDLAVRRLGMLVHEAAS
ncbi:MAG: PLP-dependent aminotransferase family protein [Janthinobacterium lividum]